MPERTPLHDVAAEAGADFVDDSGWLVPACFGEENAEKRRAQEPATMGSPSLQRGLLLAREYSQAREHAALFDMSHCGKIELSGPEAAVFLQNLCTNDIRNLAPHGGCEAFFTTTKARVIAPVLIYRLPRDPDGDAFWLDVGPGLAEKVVRHLDRHLISEQVEIAERTRDFAQLHLAGPGAAAILRETVGGLPEAVQVPSIFTVGAGTQVRRHEPLGLPGFDLLCLPDQAAGLWHKLVQAGARPAGREVYDILRVEAGTPAYGPDIGEDRFVVEIGRAQAISYSKGCYLGQEPIVMARDRGHVNRTLLGLKVEGQEPVPAGSRVLRTGSEVGQVTSSVVSPRLGPIALAYLRRGNQAPGTAVEVGAGAARRGAEVVPLPFSGAGAGAKT